MNHRNDIIDYFCHELPDKHNLLVHRKRWMQDGRVFFFGKNFGVQVLVLDYESRSDIIVREHIMVFAMN